MHRSTPHVCRCGHANEAHEHYHQGRGCSLCADRQCLSFRSERARDTLDRLLHRHAVAQVAALPRMTTAAPAAPAARHLYLVR